MTLTERDIMGGLAKGLLAIETFTTERPRQTISEVAAVSGLDRATARRCLLTLAHHGYADYDGKFFTLTPRVLRLGTACLASMPLPHLVQPLLDELSARTQESSSVSILDGAEIVYLARSAQRKVMSIGLMPGSRLPAYCTSMGRVLLAALPEAQARSVLDSTPLTARTPRTLTDPDQIMACLAEVRAQGFALNDQEIELGLRSIAVPLYNTHGKVVAAANIGVAAVQSEADELRDRFLAPLLELQNALRQMLR